MKKTISTYWPLTILLPIALVFCMHARDGASAAMHREQTGVADVSAELARAISLGLIDDDDSTPAIAAREKTL